MSDFQDEHDGLGELPGDLRSQYLEQFAPVGNIITGVAPPAPSNLTSESPKYPVSVTSTFDTIPINAKDFSVFQDASLDAARLGLSGLPGVAWIPYTSKQGYVDVIKKVKWLISPSRFFWHNTGLLSIFVGGIVVTAAANLIIRNEGELDVNIIVPENTDVKFVFDFSLNYGYITGHTYPQNPVDGTLTSNIFAEINGVSLLSRGLPANFEIGSL